MKFKYARKEVPEDVPPVYGAEYKPKQAQEDVHPAHGSVEGQQGPVSHRQVACRDGKHKRLGYRYRIQSQKLDHAYQHILNYYFFYI
jgi:hypothetical protein